jgi:endonuclease/exonuclease/phosphatase family metal-dependent hydrolase
MSSNFTIVSFNIRCTWKNTDGINSFLKRAGLIWDKITTERPEIVAFQEVTPNILRYLQDALAEDYVIYGQFRTVNYDGEGVFTAVRRDAFELLGQDVFWLSPTPHIPGSRFEGQSNCPRICVRLTLRRRGTEEQLQVYNLHLDHVSNAAREAGMSVVRADIAEQWTTKGLPIVVLGDFNAQPTDGVITYCKDGGEPHLVEVSESIPVTFHNFGQCAAKIDYLFTTAELAASCSGVGIWDDCSHGVYLSDHYPVWATLTLPEAMK